MDKWVKNLWEKNKILFFLLIPIVVIVFFRKAIIDLLIKDSRQIASEAASRDNKLSSEISAANAKADQIIEDANKKSENKPEVGEDWHKK